MMLLLSWGVAQHPNLSEDALASPEAASHETVESLSTSLATDAAAEASAPETSSETSSETLAAGDVETDGAENTANDTVTRHGAVSASEHNEASSEQHGERVGPPVVNTNLAEELLILFGSFFVLAAAIGMLRFPDFYTRLHASTKLVTLGGIGILIGAAFGFNDVQVSLRVILIIIFFFLTAPLSGYMIGRAGYLRGLPFYKEWGSIDEWQALGSGSAEPEATD